MLKVVTLRWTNTALNPSNIIVRRKFDDGEYVQIAKLEPVEDNLVEVLDMDALSNVTNVTYEVNTVLYVGEFVFDGIPATVTADLSVVEDGDDIIVPPVNPPEQNYNILFKITDRTTWGLEEDNSSISEFVITEDQPLYAHTAITGAGSQVIPLSMAAVNSVAVVGEDSAIFSVPGDGYHVVPLTVSSIEAGVESIAFQLTDTDKNAIVATTPAIPVPHVSRLRVRGTAQEDRVKAGEYFVPKVDIYDAVGNIITPRLDENGLIIDPEHQYRIAVWTESATLEGGANQPPGFYFISDEYVAIQAISLVNPELKSDIINVSCDPLEHLNAEIHVQEGIRPGIGNVFTPTVTFHDPDTGALVEVDRDANGYPTNKYYQYTLGVDAGSITQVTVNGLPSARVANNQSNIRIVAVTRKVTRYIDTNRSNNVLVTISPGGGPKFEFFSTDWSKLYSIQEEYGPVIASGSELTARNSYIHTNDYFYQYVAGDTMGRIINLKDVETTIQITPVNDIVSADPNIPDPDYKAWDYVEAQEMGNAVFYPSPQKYNVLAVLAPSNITSVSVSLKPVLEDGTPIEHKQVPSGTPVYVQPFYTTAATPKLLPAKGGTLTQGTHVQSFVNGDGKSFEPIFAGVKEWDGPFNIRVPLIEDLVVGDGFALVPYGTIEVQTKRWKSIENGDTPFYLTDNVNTHEYRINSASDHSLEQSNSLVPLDSIDVIAGNNVEFSFPIEFVGMYISTGVGSYYKSTFEERNGRAWAQQTTDWGNAGTSRTYFVWSRFVEDTTNPGLDRDRLILTLSVNIVLPPEETPQ